MDWTESHRPKSLSDVRGNKSALRKLNKWADSWNTGSEPVILHGPPGIGKTTAAHALAKDRGWDTVELNASETRTQDVVETVAGGAARTGTIQGGVSGRRMVVLDEADNLHGNVDYGGAAAMTKLAKNASQPVVLIANDFYDMSKTLRNYCDTIEFEFVDSSTIAKFLRDICEEEEIGYEMEGLKQLAANADGDVRGAVNDLQATTLGGNDITTAAIQESTRDRTEELFPFLDIVLQNGSAQEAQEAAYNTDETPDDLIQWIEENVLAEYNGKEVSRAYEWLARSDEWLGRVRASQNYSYWRYASDSMTAGVAASRGRHHGGWTRWNMPSTWRKLGQTRGKRNQRDDIAKRIAQQGNVSTETARTELLPVLQMLTHHCKPRELTIKMAATYELDEQDVSFITGSGEDTQKVADIVETAEQRQLEAIPAPDVVEGKQSSQEDARGNGVRVEDQFNVETDITEHEEKNVNAGAGSNGNQETDTSTDDEDDSVQTTLF